MPLDRCVAASGGGAGALGVRGTRARHVPPLARTHAALPRAHPSSRAPDPPASSPRSPPAPLPPIPAPSFSAASASASPGFSNSTTQTPRPSCTAPWRGEQRRGAGGEPRALPRPLASLPLLRLLCCSCPGGLPPNAWPDSASPRPAPLLLRPNPTANSGPDPRGPPRSYRVFDLASYRLLHALPAAGVADVKMSGGLLLAVREAGAGVLPLEVYSAENGQARGGGARRAPGSRPAAALLAPRPPPCPSAPKPTCWRPPRHPRAPVAHGPPQAPPPRPLTPAPAGRS